MKRISTRPSVFPRRRRRIPRHRSRSNRKAIHRRVCYSTGTRREKGRRGLSMLTDACSTFRPIAREVALGRGQPRRAGRLGEDAGHIAMVRCKRPVTSHIDRPLSLQPNTIVPSARFRACWLHPSLSCGSVRTGSSFALGGTTPSVASPFPGRSIHRTFLSFAQVSLPSCHARLPIHQRASGSVPSWSFHATFPFPAISASPRPPRLVLPRETVGPESTVRFFPSLCPANRGSNPGLPGRTPGRTPGVVPLHPRMETRRRRTDGTKGHRRSTSTIGPRRSDQARDAMAQNEASKPMAKVRVPEGGAWKKGKEDPNEAWKGRGKVDARDGSVERAIGPGKTTHARGNSSVRQTDGAG